MKYAFTFLFMFFFFGYAALAIIGADPRSMEFLLGALLVAMLFEMKDQDAAKKKEPEKK